MEVNLQESLFDEPQETKNKVITMKLKLNALGMTSLHKAGLAGLYMTLRAFEKREEKIDGLEWTLEEKQIVLRWMPTKLKVAFEKLIQKSFWIDEEGFIRLAGLEADREMSFEQRHYLYTALLNSFLQFGPHRPTEKKKTLTYEVDNKVCWVKEFAPIKNIRQHDAVKDFIDDKGNFNASIEAAGWLFPGASQRHQVHSNTKLNESTETALLLMFAPVGVVYYKINSRAKGRKARLAMLVPEIQDLELYADVRRAIASQSVIELTASSASDAALRLLITIASNRTSNEFARIFGSNFICRVITLGIVPWNEKQKTRTFARTVFSGRLQGLEKYRLADAIFKNRWQKIQAKINRQGVQTEPERFFVTTFSAREMIADNIAQGKAWYHDITTFMSHKETREQLYYEQKELGEMVSKNEAFDDDSERLFIRVCHESWRRRLGKLGQRAIRENANFNSLINKESEKLRTSLVRSKNAETLRETVVDFWARAGLNEELQGDGLIKLLPLFNEKNWRKTRDLALLALISYKPQSKEEEDALKIEINEEGEQDK
jgi:CRISPR-associated protein Cas8a1/Csx13